MLAAAAIAFAATIGSACVQSGGLQHREAWSEPGPSTSAGPVLPRVDTIQHPVCHIIEEPGGIRHMTDCEIPTEEYYDALAKDMAKRHPDASPSLLEHLAALEPFLDTSILSGFSYGVSKAFVAVTKGSLLGNHVSRTGAKAEEERTQAIWDFAPLREESHVRQFIGSTNWVRGYVSAQYATAAKILGEYMKPGADFGRASLDARLEPLSTEQEPGVDGRAARAPAPRECGA